MLIHSWGECNINSKRIEMKFYTSIDIITKKVLNENTGELEDKQFIEKKYRKKIRGGYNLMYHIDFFEIENKVIRSSKDMELFNWITNQFTYKQVEVNLSYSICPIKISQPQFAKMIKKLIEIGYLMRIRRGIYRLNPFVYVPYKANAEELQEEWLELKKQKEQEELQKSIESLKKKMYE